MEFPRLLYRVGNFWALESGTYDLAVATDADHLAALLADLEQRIRQLQPTFDEVFDWPVVKNLGLFTYLVAMSNGPRPGDIARKLNKDGYVLITIRRWKWRAHRLAWLWMTGEHPEHDIDHRNTIRTDNRWENLRLDTDGQNLQNVRRPYANNTTGYLGVSYDKARGLYVAGIRVNGRRRALGRYATPEEAHAAYLKAKRELHPFGTL